MREILFRGKYTGTGEWVIDYLVDYNSDVAHIRTKGKDGAAFFDYEVFSETVGQYTGLTDKNGKKIFEVDILRDTDSGYNYQVKYYEDYACFAFGSQWGDIQIDNPEDYIEYMEIVGNIHDNPELLEVGG